MVDFKLSLKPFPQTGGSSQCFYKYCCCLFVFKNVGQQTLLGSRVVNSQNSYISRDDNPFITIITWVPLFFDTVLKRDYSVFRNNFDFFNDILN